MKVANFLLLDWGKKISALPCKIYYKLSLTHIFLASTRELRPWIIELGKFAASHACIHEWSIPTQKFYYKHSNTHCTLALRASHPTCSISSTCFSHISRARRLSNCLCFHFSLNLSPPSKGECPSPSWKSGTGSVDWKTSRHRNFPTFPATFHSFVDKLCRRTKCFTLKLPRRSDFEEKTAEVKKFAIWIN